MTWHLANPWMLLGLLGVAIPVVIHLLNRRRTEVIDWGAMQFLEIGRRARQRIQVADLLLMACRMLLLGLVVLAVARPFRAPREAVGANRDAASSGGRRDVVLVLDGSDSMLRRDGGTTARDRAMTWARDFLGRLAPGSSVAVLMARDRVRPLVDRLSFDGAKVLEALDHASSARGTSDLPTAIAEALERLEAGQNPARDVVILTDGQKVPWRTGEPRRWALLRELHRDAARRQGVEARIWAVAFRPGSRPAGADGAVEEIELARGLVPPFLPLAVRAVIANAGPEPLSRTVELLVDGRAVPGSIQTVGPIPAGGRTPVTFKASLADPGSHALTVRLTPADDDPLPANDEASRPVEVVPALPVLLVDGEPGREPLAGETDFLRAALAPAGDDTPQVAATIVPLPDFQPGSLTNQKVVVLANVDRLDPPQASAVSTFVAGGGGLLVAPGDRTDVDSLNKQAYRGGSGWLPARLGPWRGEPSRRDVAAHPAPPSFHGSSLAPFGQEASPALGEASLFAYRVLEPAPSATVLARLDSGDPWIVERTYHKGRVIVMAGPLDAEGGTLPVNPDFVPLLHELVYHLADPRLSSGVVRPGEPLVIPLPSWPDAAPKSLTVTTPSGEQRQAAVEREAGRVRAVLESADEPGLYRFDLPTPPGGSAYATVAADPREADPTPLSEAEASRLSESWPLVFASQPEPVADRLLASRQNGRPRPIWRTLILLALAGLCLEVVLTRQTAHRRGMTPLRDED
jgi:hypothetical protein